MNIASRSLVEVGVSMVLRDNFTKEAGKISQSFRSMMSDLDTMGRGYKASFGDISEIGMDLVGSMYRAYKYSAGVQNEIWLTSKIAGANIKEAKELWDVAQQVNKETPLTAAQVASAERYLAMAGNSAKQIKDLIGPASKLASIFGIDPGGKGGLADMMTNIMAMFQIDSSKATQVVDDLYTAVTNANMSMEDLMATIRYSGADMNAAGVSLREVAAAAGALGDVGIQGTMAGTSLGNMMRYFQLSISGQKKYGIDTLTKWGLGKEDFYDEQGQFKGLGNFLGKFYEIYKQMTPLQRTQDFYNIFSVRGMRALIPMMEAIEAGNDKFLKIMEKYEGNKGIVDRINEERKSTNAGLIDQFESSIENLIATFGQSSEGPWRFLLEAGTDITDRLNEFAASQFGAKVISHSVGLIITTTVWMTLKGILAFIQNISNYTAAIQTSLTTTATASQANGAVLREGIVNIASNLLTVVNNQRIMIGLLGRMVGLELNSKGMWMVGNPSVYDQYNGKKTNKHGKPLGPTRRGQFGNGPRAGGYVGAGLVLPQPSTPSGPNVGGTKVGGIFGRIAGGVGSIAGLALKAVNIAGWILTAVQVIGAMIDIFGSDISENTAEMREKERKKRKENEELWFEAVKQGIIAGMKESNIKITVDPGVTDAIQVGTRDYEDYTGGALLGL